MYVRRVSPRPPNVLLGETRQLCRILVAFTLPDLGGEPAACQRPSRPPDTKAGRAAHRSTPAGLKVALELRAKRTNLVGSAERVHALIQAALWCRPRRELVLVRCSHATKPINADVSGDKHTKRWISRR